MSPWFIFILVLGPFVLLTAWVLIAQLRGQFSEPEPVRAEPDFFQRNATLMILIVVGAYSFLTSGVPGLIAATVVVLLLSLIAALIATVLEGRRLRSNRTTAISDTCLDDTQLEPSLRRFVRHFRSAIPEMMSYIS